MRWITLRPRWDKAEPWRAGACLERLHFSPALAKESPRDGAGKGLHRGGRTFAKHPFGSRGK